MQIAWNTRDFTNTDSGSNSLPGGRGATLPIPLNALGTTVTANAGGTYTVMSPLPLPVTATGTGEVIMEGHPAGQDATGAWTVRVPVRSAYRYFPITDASIVPRRQIVDVNKCMVCHRSDGTGVAPRLTLHGNNPTEEPQVCVTGHNPNNTDIGLRLATDPKVIVGSFTYPEQSLDFKTFELPLGSNVLGPSFDTKSFNPGGTVTIDTNPANDVKISPTASVCSSCHDDRETIPT